MEDFEDKLSLNANGLSLLCKSIVHASGCDETGPVPPELVVKAKRVLDSLLSVQNPVKTLWDDLVSELPEHVLAGFVGKYVAEIYFQVSCDHQRDIIDGLRGLFKKRPSSEKNRFEEWFTAGEIRHHLTTFGTSGKGKSALSRSLSPLYVLTRDFLKNSYGLSFDSCGAKNSLKSPFKNITSSQGKRLIHVLLTLNEAKVDYTLSLRTDIISLTMSVNDSGSELSSNNLIKEVLLLSYKVPLKDLFIDPKFIKVLAHLYSKKFDSDMASGVTYRRQGITRSGSEDSNGVIFLGPSSRLDMVDTLTSNVRCHQLVPAYCAIYSSIADKASNFKKMKRVVQDTILSSVRSFLLTHVIVDEHINEVIDHYDELLLGIGLSELSPISPPISWREKVKKSIQSRLFSLNDDSDIINDEVPFYSLLEIVRLHKSKGLSGIHRGTDFIYLTRLGRVTFTEALSEDISDSTKSLLLTSLS